MERSVGVGEAARPLDRDELKEIKVKIPISQHIKLHSIRLMMDQSISESVQKALDMYFGLLKAQVESSAESGADAGTGTLDAYVEA